MGLEAGVTEISDLNENWPLDDDLRYEGDDHLRNVKIALKSLLTNIAQIGMVVEDHVLTENTEISATEAAAEGKVLTVFIAQDATGGWTITWNSSHFKAFTTDIDLGASKTSIYHFVGRDDNLWWMVCPPILGVS